MPTPGPPPPTAVAMWRRGDWQSLRRMQARPQFRPATNHSRYLVPEQWAGRRWQWRPWRGWGGTPLHCCCLLFQWTSDKRATTVPTTVPTTTPEAGRRREIAPHPSVPAGGVAAANSPFLQTVGPPPIGNVLAFAMVRLLLERILEAAVWRCYSLRPLWWRPRDRQSSVRWEAIEAEGAATMVAG